MEVVALEKLSTFEHIIDNLYLGDAESAISHHIHENTIQIIVNVSNTRYEYFEGIVYDIDDDSSTNIHQYFEIFVSLIQDNSTRNILVHCQNSVSRSVTLVLAYLIRGGKTLLEAFEYLKAKRTQYTCPNRGFIKQLSQYEMELYGKISINPIEMFKSIKNQSDYLNLK
eukprot:gene14900-16583_t